MNIASFIRVIESRISGGTGSEGGTPIQDAKNQGKVQVQVSGSVPFPCNVTGTVVIHEVDRHNGGCDYSAVLIRI